MAKMCMSRNTTSVCSRLDGLFDPSGMAVCSPGSRPKLKQSLPPRMLEKKEWLSHRVQGLITSGDPISTAATLCCDELNAGAITTTAKGGGTATTPEPDDELLRAGNAAGGGKCATLCVVVYCCCGDVLEKYCCICWVLGEGELKSICGEAEDVEVAVGVEAGDNKDCGRFVGVGLTTFKDSFEDDN
ncbi:hypothetical protein FF38_04488 [Lucilia cuprina]|uniref:Uncharacterized protein n=1 Tax=Lucilia cuprina TaxID=7375 RepID=A0A0L0CAA1_LUCCU|nr:hypothetical protein FF38_04488 [Lucilia cuprina]